MVLELDEEYLSFRTCSFITHQELPHCRREVSSHSLLLSKEVSRLTKSWLVFRIHVDAHLSSIKFFYKLIKNTEGWEAE